MPAWDLYTQRAAEQARIPEAGGLGPMGKVAMPAEPSLFVHGLQLASISTWLSVSVCTVTSSVHTLTALSVRTVALFTLEYHKNQQTGPMEDILSLLKEQNHFS